MADEYKWPLGLPHNRPQQDGYSTRSYMPEGTCYPCLIRHSHTLLEVTAHTERKGQGVGVGGFPRIASN